MESKGLAAKVKAVTKWRLKERTGTGTHVHAKRSGSFDRVHEALPEKNRDSNQSHYDHNSKCDLVKAAELKLIFFLHLNNIRMTISLKNWWLQGLNPRPLVREPTRLTF